MLRKLFGIVIFSLILTISTAFAFDETKNINRAADEKAVRETVVKIFDAFVKRDPDTIRALHSTNWRGFSGDKVAKGIEEYMKNARIGDPKSPNGMYDYKFLDYDTVFYGETAVVSFVVELFFRNGEQTNSSKYRSLDIYAKENGNWTQVASNFISLPSEFTKFMTTNNPLSSQMRQYLLKARDDVWKAFFANDVEKLKKMIPEETVAINPGEEKFDNQTSIFASAKAFAESGAKLVKIEFPITEFQTYGQTVIMYSTYVYEIENKGEKKSYSGRASEVFIVHSTGEVKNVGWHLDDGK